MKLISVVKKIDDIDRLSFVDMLIFPTIYSIYYDKAFNIDEIKEAIEKCNKLSIIPIISIDGLIEEDSLENVYSYLDVISDMQSAFMSAMIMFSDMAVMAYYKKINKLDRLIYNAPTYICNKEDIMYYQKMGILVMSSLELSLYDVEINAKFGNLILQVYGYFPIYYSKRKVLSLYKEYANLDYNPYIEKEIKEELREEKYKIREYSSIPHSVILSANKICIFEELENIKPNYIYVNTDNIEVLKLYKDGMDKGFKEENALALKEIDGRIDKSLLYVRPAILKEDE